ncbi:hypothetical protein [Gallionella capsiferriformans]|uniref:Stationary phase growth adaptation protein n=1 Tax=Gallionella capsiferriformans (strain ES-2) TaxID=395494 RepID=D9SDV0_GALCS|nr:hypothetical protein [Gallionella capsiferriformans]ADL54857.1 hypothetical protein Galf_0821 [Gallionella capsiferriformans ES-2]
MNNTVENIEASEENQLMGQHHDAVEPHHRFGIIQYKADTWDLSHLEAFAIRIDPNLGFEIHVIILFSCHCFSHSIKHDDRVESQIPAEEIFDNGRERRVLNEQRYRLSIQYLPKIIHELQQRKIQIAGSDVQNFVTFEIPDSDSSQTAARYAIFFEVEKSKSRKKHVLLRVQSAYILEKITDRQRKSGKVSFNALLKAVYEGRKIKG